MRYKTTKGTSGKICCHTNDYTDLCDPCKAITPAPTAAAKPEMRTQAEWLDHFAKTYAAHEEPPTPPSLVDAIRAGKTSGIVPAATADPTPGVPAAPSLIDAIRATRGGAR